MLKRHQAQYLMGEGKTEEALEILRQAVEELEKGGRENPIFIELAMCCHVQESAICGKANGKKPGLLWKRHPSWENSIFIPERKGFLWRCCYSSGPYGTI